VRLRGRRWATGGRLAAGAPYGQAVLWSTLAAGALIVLVVVVSIGAYVSMRNDCSRPPATTSGPPASAFARDAIPPEALRLYQRFGERYDVDWAFLAAIGAQESDHGRNPAARRVNRAGCQGWMQLGTGGRCGDFWARNRQDGDGDGRADILNPADNIATAAYGLRYEKGAPPVGGPLTPITMRAPTYGGAACRYYGACADGMADYANLVIARAKRYGMREGQATSVAPSEAQLTAASSTSAVGDGRPHGAWSMLSGDLDFQPAVGDALQRMAAATNTRISVTSGGRRMDEQEALYGAYLDGTGNLAAKPTPTAPHVRGVAADITPGRETFGSVAARYQLAFTVSTESWHIELTTTRTSSATTGIAAASGCAGRGAYQPVAAGPLARAVVEVARRELEGDFGEKPPGSNCTKYGPCESWCADFTSYVYQQAGIRVPRMPAVEQWTRLGMQVGKLDKRPDPGDVIVYGGGQHIGIVETVNGTRITTIEGNTSRQRVSRKGPADWRSGAFHAARVTGFISPEAIQEAAQVMTA
jgi:hypothetical protein